LDLSDEDITLDNSPELQSLNLSHLLFEDQNKRRISME
jgi:hypothetical protein